MTTQKRYFVKVQTNENKVRTVTVYGHNEAEAKKWAIKCNGVHSIISVFCDGEAVEEFEEI